MATQVMTDVGDEIPQTLAFVIPCHLVMYIAEDPLNRIGALATGGQPQRLKTRMNQFYCAIDTK